MEPSLTFVLGPPPEGWQKELFEKYQQARKETLPKDESDWEDFERNIIAGLFRHEDESPSLIENRFCGLLEAPVKIIDYRFSMGLYRGEWVAMITIPVSGVLRGVGSMTST